MNEHSNVDTAREPIFSRKKSLLTVGQYAARQGVSTGIVQEAAKLGVVQVRKHKNKTFIVDLPLDTYRMLKQQDLGCSETADSAASVNKISELVNRIFQSDTVLEQNLKKPAVAARNIGAIAAGKPQNNAPAAIPDLKLFAREETTVLSCQPPRFTQSGAAGESESGGLPAAQGSQDEPVKFHIPLLRGIMDSLRALPKWKLNTIIVASAFVIIACAYTCVSIDRKIQQEKLHQAYENIGKLMTEYENTRQKARLYEFDMMNWRSEAERSKRALWGSENELNEARKRLYDARKDLQTLQQHDTETSKTFSEQTNKAASQMPNPDGSDSLVQK